LFDKRRTTLLQCPGGKIGNYSIPVTVTNIGVAAFYGCASLSGVTIPNSVVNIGVSAFEYCNSLNSLTIPNSVTGIGNCAFGSCDSCTNLLSVFFAGSAPKVNPGVFDIYSRATVYYLPGATNWTSTFSRRPTLLWNPQALTSDPRFGVLTNGFGFTITGTTNIPLVIEASTDLASPAWFPLQTCTLANGSLYFSDPAWTNFPRRFYRFRSP
jgi:hypothetical protein